jgi:acyl-CoA dehydrogenase
MYRAPVDDIAATLKHVAGIQDAIDTGRLGDLTADLVDAVLQEAGRFAGEEIAPLNRVGDEQGAVLKDAAVTMPEGWKELYGNWIAGGWNALAAPVEYGGQGLPMMLSVATLEMWNSGSLAFGIGPTLTMGAVEALDKHGSAHLRETYLRKLVSGEWMGTMNLTEPQAGSDLAALRSRAEPAGDGTFRIFGQKIFITYGEHDLTDNIVHLVLARLPDAPAGTRGISLFLVPKFLVVEDGSLGARNDVHCAGLEHKLGIHASPTCTMVYGDGFGDVGKGAVGWLVGEDNRGLACMFTMMNNARLSVGMQGVAVAEAAFQMARAYANERRQGKASGWSGGGMAPIVHHPDVQRMLLTMQGLTQAARAIAYSCAHAIDLARVSTGDEARHWQDRTGLLTPVAKAFSTDVGMEVASLGVQVHGGMGFIEETGAAVLYRDSRIAPIYEGTNGIQAIDLVTRKLPLSGGDSVRGFIAELHRVADDVGRSSDRAFGETAARLRASIEDLRAATEHLLTLLADGRQDDALAGATPYLRLFALAAGGNYLARLALGDTARIGLCRFFAENLLADTAGLGLRVTHGGGSLRAAAASLIA